MAKSNKMDELLAKRSPAELRAVPIKPVHIIEEATQIREQEERADQPEQKPVEKPDEVAQTTNSTGKSEKQSPSTIASDKPDEQEPARKPNTSSAVKKRSSQPRG